MVNLAKLRLVDGALVDTRTRGEALVERMACELIRQQAANDQGDAIRTLHACGFADADIATLVGDARNLAFQEIVAAEVSRP